MKTYYFKSRKPKKRQQISAAVAATLRGFIAKTWVVIGSLRKERNYDTNKKPWNPCLRAQQNYVAWCRKHEVNPECWDNFVYYFGIRRLFWEKIGGFGIGAMMPDEGVSLASMELEIADGSAGWFGWAGQTIKQEFLTEYKDLWHVVFTARATQEDGTEDFHLKKKLIIKAKSYSMDDKPLGPQWSVSYQNKPTWGGPRCRSRTVIEYVENPHTTRANYSQWWQPVLQSLKPNGLLNRNLQVQVQPLTYRERHEIQNCLYPNYGDDFE